MSLRVHCLQHVPFEGLGSIGSWLESRAAEITVSRLYRDDPLPEPRDLDWLIAVGGPMSVNDEKSHPWLAREKRFIAEVIAEEATVLGICLGAQLIASSLGAEVFTNAEREIGWFPIEPVSHAARSPFASLLASPLEAFHWHGETFGLPEGAIRLARSAACENQAFSVGDRVLGLQFHLETTEAAARSLIKECPQDLAPGRWVQSPSEILREPHRFGRIHRVMDAVLQRLESLAE